MAEVAENAGIRVRDVGYCDCCGSSGRVLYHDMHDMLFAAPGSWRVMACSGPNCGLMWLSPRPLEQDIGKLYLSYYTHQDTLLHPSLRRRILGSLEDAYLAEKYGYKGGRNGAWQRILALALCLHPGKRADADFSVMHLPATLRGRLLDVGCGSGVQLERMRALGWEVEGVDVDAAAVQNARRKGLNIHLGDLEDCRFPDGSFDVVTMSHLIEHVGNPQRLLRECHRILKPSGRLVLVTPNAQSWGHRIFRDRWRGLEVPRHLFVFTVSTLRHLAESANFRTVNASTTIRGAAWMFFASKCLRQRGTFESGQRPAVWVWLWAEAMRLLEWAMLKARWNVGEEILLIAHK
jgi:2-polyprenyl-3-methyl-5-hydroxy-6-metoxy-1,4-benzoquinol methylase